VRQIFFEINFYILILAKIRVIHILYEGLNNVLKILNLQKILVGLDIFRKLLYNHDSCINQGGIIGTQHKMTNGSNVTQNTMH
jgi:hypothetical protein